jgi:hypothetical protein
MDTNHSSRVTLAPSANAPASSYLATIHPRRTPADDRLVICAAREAEQGRGRTRRVSLLASEVLSGVLESRTRL